MGRVGGVVLGRAGGRGGAFRPPSPPIPPRPGPLAQASPLARAFGPGPPSPPSKGPPDIRLKLAQAKSELMQRANSGPGHQADDTRLTPG